MCKTSRRIDQIYVYYCYYVNYFVYKKTMVKNILIKSPDEWATTKQACRDESVAYLFLSSTNIYFALH